MNPSTSSGRILNQGFGKIVTLVMCGALLATVLSGCGEEQQGAGDPAVETTAPKPDNSAEPDTSAPAVSPSPEETEDQSGQGAVSDAEIAGTVALSWTAGAEHKNFEYVAEQCYVGPDYILVEGTGGPLGGGGSSQLNIFTAPVELLHESTQTFQAEGIVKFTWDDEEIIADGRTIHVGEHPQPAVFTYRQDSNSAKYVVSWFIGANEAGAGAVEVICNY